MKKIVMISTLILTIVVVLISCDGPRREPGRIYMPDMAYSRAYETYAQLDSNVFGDRSASHKIFYNASPVSGSVKRGELFSYDLPDDSVGYKLSAAVKSPLGPLSKIEMAEAGRLYNINCGICHGEKGIANGPVAGKIGAVANLTLPDYVKMADGTMFHSITYGKNNMGSYASQVDRKQRWMIIQYIRTLQPKVEGAKTDSIATIMAVKK
jgi:mono/diheme cytochrome c family protein